MDDVCLPRAFQVEEITENFDPSILPTNGLEYLQHVMYVYYLLLIIGLNGLSNKY